MKERCLFKVYLPPFHLLLIFLPHPLSPCLLISFSWESTPLCFNWKNNAGELEQGLRRGGLNVYTCITHKPTTEKTCTYIIDNHLISELSVNNATKIQLLIFHVHKAAVAMFSSSVFSILIHSCCRNPSLV